MIARLWLALLLTLPAVSGSTHESRPVYLQLQEKESGVYLAQWKMPLSLSALPDVIMPDGCQARAAALLLRQSDAYMKRQAFLGEGGLSGRRLGIQFPGVNPSVTTIVQVDLRNGESHTHLIKPGKTGWKLPAREAPGAVAAEYTLLGIEHIWLGLDHLLFVACLLFIARTPGRLLLTITGFTLSHSLTLALSTLGWVRLPVPPVEAAIALSIVFLACEIASPDKRSWTWRYPVLVSSLFGLLHGFGFASVLQDIGLPQTQLPMALLTFNIGVEIGQLLFVAACLLICALVRRVLQPMPGGWSRLSQLPNYIVGSLAGFCCQRQGARGYVGRQNFRRGVEKLCGHCR